MPRKGRGKHTPFTSEPSKPHSSKGESQRHVDIHHYGEHGKHEPDLDVHHVTDEGHVSYGEDFHSDKD